MRRPGAITRGSFAFALALVAMLPARAPAAADLAAELSLIVPPAPAAAGDTFAIFLSGDGGWAELDREVARRLTAADIPVVGWNSRSYYWTRKTPEAAAGALGRIIDRFRAEWKRPRVVLVGYSRGGDVLPFLVNRLSDAQRANLTLVAVLGPGRAIDFEFHLTDWLREPDAKTASPVAPEIEVLAARRDPLLVIYGEDDKISSGPDLATRLPGVVCVPGDHHFARDFDRLAQLIIDAARAKSPAG